MTDSHFLSGVIEGFYGRPWSFETRASYATYLSQLGLNASLYCPKSDPFLRKSWFQHWPLEQWRQLLALARGYREEGVGWGVGLSPFELYARYDGEARRALKNKVERLQELEAPLLAILFDDMPGDLDELAARQAQIVADVCEWSRGTRVLVCPTYYSFDPVLERFFGERPEGYWRDLGRLLPPGVDVFWTGNDVCSETIARADIEAIVAELGRPVVLWDNYPVNDGAKRSTFLYGPKVGRIEPMGDLLAGHFSNPMNQGLLSLPAVAELARSQGLVRDAEGWLGDTLGRETYRRFCEDIEEFQQLGLAGMGPERCRQHASIYRSLPGPAAQEVAAWLSGEYTFDPECLTD